MSRNPEFESFFTEHHEAVVRALTLALADRVAAEDAAQEAFAKAYRQWRRVEMMDRPVAWVYVVALNGARRTRKRDLAAPAPDLVGPAPDLADPVTVRVSVREALDLLAPRQRVAVVLRYLADLRVTEVADAMGCSEGTAKATLHTALARMRVELGPDDATDPDGAPANVLAHAADPGAVGAPSPGRLASPMALSVRPAGVPGESEVSTR
jgi:RNA polymerase sigma factor (sigma-70 family)